MVHTRLHLKQDNLTPSWLHIHAQSWASFYLFIFFHHTFMRWKAFSLVNFQQAVMCGKMFTGSSFISQAVLQIIGKRN